MMRCEFGLCARDAELRILVGSEDLEVRVCGLHIGPLLSWGLPEPANGHAIQILRRSPS